MNVQEAAGANPAKGMGCLKMTKTQAVKKINQLVKEFKLSQDIQDLYFAIGFIEQMARTNVISIAEYWKYFNKAKSVRTF